MNVNNLTISGRLCKEVELKTLENGATVASMFFANSKKYKDKAGELKETTSFLNAEIWGPQAKAVKEYLVVGQELIICGEIISQSWEDKETKQKRSKVFINCQSVQFGNKPKPKEDAVKDAEIVKEPAEEKATEEKVVVPEEKKEKAPEDVEKEEEFL